MSSKRTSARLRSAARKRMEETGEKYTEALRIVTSEDRGTKVTGTPGHGFTRQAVEMMEMLYPNETDEEIHARLVDQAEGFPFAIGNGGETLHFDTSEPSPHQIVAGLAGTGALKSSEYDAIFGRVSSMNLSAHSDTLISETKEYADQGLPFVTLNTGADRREATRQAIRDYGVPTLVVGERFDDYEDPLAVYVHPDDLTAEIIESPLLGYYVIDNVNRAVEDLNGMALITNLVATARSKGRAIRLLQESEDMVPAAIAGAVTKRIVSEPEFGLIEVGSRLSMGSRTYAKVFDDGTGIDFAGGGAHLLVAGAAGTGKTVLLQHIMKKMRGQGFEVNVVNPRPFPNEYGEKNDPRSVPEIIKHVQGIMQSRYAALEERGINSAQEAGDMPPVFLFLDYAEYLFDGSNVTESFASPEEAEEARFVIRTLLHVGRDVSVHLVFGQQRASSEITGDMGALDFAHRILMGRASASQRAEMFRAPVADTQGERKHGEGVYQDADGNVRRIRVLPLSESN